MLKGKENTIMSKHGTGGWDTKQILYAQIAGKIKKVEKEIEYYKSFESPGNEDVLEDIIEGYKKELTELRGAYAKAKKL